MTERRYGAGQGHPIGWTWDEMTNPADAVEGHHMARCVHGDLIAEIERLRAGVTGLGLLPPSFAAAIAAEREACAKIADEEAKENDEDYGAGWLAEDIASSIRARA